MSCHELLLDWCLIDESFELLYASVMRLSMVNDGANTVSLIEYSSLSLLLIIIVDLYCED